jgi:hypothetical protein
MEVMVGISLCNYLFLKLAKMLCLSYYLLCFLFNKIREEVGGTSSAWKWEIESERMVEVAQTMYTHVSKCKNEKNKRKKSKWKASSHCNTKENNEVDKACLVLCRLFSPLHGFPSSPSSPHTLCTQNFLLFSSIKSRFQEKIWFHLLVSLLRI